MVRLNCAVPGCPSVKTDGMQMFHTPRDQDFSLRWKKLIGNVEPMNSWKTALLCENHFLDEDYTIVMKGTHQGRRKLVKGVVPCRNLPEHAILAEIHNYNIPIFIPHQPGNPAFGVKAQNKLRTDPTFVNDPTFENIFPDGDEEEQQEKLPEPQHELIAMLNEPPKKRQKRRKKMTKEEIKAEKKRLKKLKNMPSPEEMLDKETIDILRKRIVSLKEGKLKLQKENAQLNQKILKLKKSSKKLTEKDKEEMVNEVMSKHFSKAQIKCFMRGNWQQSKLWEERDYKTALMLHTISKRCFHYLRNHQVLPMPSYTSLKKHTFDDGSDLKTAVDVIKSTQQIPDGFEPETVTVEQKFCDCVEDPCEHTPTTVVYTTDGQEIHQYEEGQVTVMNILDHQETVEQQQDLQMQPQIVHHVIEGQELLEGQEIHMQQVGDQIQYFIV